MDGEPDLPELFGNDQKLNKKQVFSMESKEQHQNSKRTEIILHMKGLPPPQFFALYVKV